jgi:hypothetical protein
MTQRDVQSLKTALSGRSFFVVTENELSTAFEFNRLPS